MKVGYIVYHKPSKAYVYSAGYYGNEHNIQVYLDKEQAKRIYVAYGSEYTIKKVRLK